MSISLVKLRPLDLNTVSLDCNLSRSILPIQEKTLEHFEDEAPKNEEKKPSLPTDQPAQNLGLKKTNEFRNWLFVGRH